MPDWKESTGLADDTDVVKIYTHVDIKEQWKHEASEQDLSLSKYLYRLIQEARYHRIHGPDETQSSNEQADPEKEEIEALEQRIVKLEDRLEEVDDNGFT